MRPQLNLDRVIAHMKHNGVRPRYVAVQASDSADYNVLDRGIWGNDTFIEATFTTPRAAEDAAWRLSAEQYIADTFIDQLG